MVVGGGIESPNQSTITSSALNCMKTGKDCPYCDSLSHSSWKITLRFNAYTKEKFTVIGQYEIVLVVDSNKLIKTEFP